MLISRVYQTKAIYSQTCVQRPPLGLKKVAVVQRLRQRGRYSQFIPIKFAMSFEKLELELAVVDRWPLLRCGR